MVFFHNCVFKLARPVSYSFPSLCWHQVSFNKRPPLLAGLAACLQLWLKLFGESGTAPIPVHGPSQGDEEKEETVLDVAWWTTDSLPYLCKHDSWRHAGGGGSARRAPSESSRLVDLSLSPPLFSILVSLSFIVSDVLLVCKADAL